MSEQQEYIIRHNKAYCLRAIKRERLRLSLIRATQFRRAGNNQKESAYLAGANINTYQLHQRDFDSFTDRELEEEERKQLDRIAELMKISKNIGKKRARDNKTACMKFSPGRSVSSEGRLTYQLFSNEQFAKLCTYYQAEPDIERFNVWFAVNALCDYRYLLKKLRNLYVGKMCHAGLGMTAISQKVHAMAVKYPQLVIIQPDKVSAVRAELLTKHPFNISLSGLYRYQHGFDDVSDAELDDEIQKTLREMNLMNVEYVQGAEL